ncbi:hypothetical protein HDV00_002863 [Rhizophlyctis rosea]|nr:hypothetical protein HDV00_002863 [Rhizophlyctis rosea]
MRHNNVAYALKSLTRLLPQLRNVENIEDNKERIRYRSLLLEKLVKELKILGYEDDTVLKAEPEFEKWLEADENKLMDSTDAKYLCYSCHMGFEEEEQHEAHRKEPRHKEMRRFFQLKQFLLFPSVRELNPLSVTIKVMDDMQLMNFLLSKVAQLRKQRGNAQPGDTITAEEIQDAFFCLHPNIVRRVNTTTWNTVAQASRGMIRILRRRIEAIEKELEGVDVEALMEKLVEYISTYMVSIPLKRKMDIGTTDRCPEWRVLDRAYPIYEAELKRLGDAPKAKEAALLAALLPAIENDHHTKWVKQENEATPFFRQYINSLPARRQKVNRRWVTVRKLGDRMDDVETTIATAQQEGRENNFSEEEKKKRKAEREAMSQPVQQEYERELMDFVMKTMEVLSQCILPINWMLHERHIFLDHFYGKPKLRESPRCCPECPCPFCQVPGPDVPLENREVDPDEYCNCSWCLITHCSAGYIMRLAKSMGWCKKYEEEEKKNLAKHEKLKSEIEVRFEEYMALDRKERRAAAEAEGKPDIQIEDYVPIEEEVKPRAVTPRAMNFDEFCDDEEEGGDHEGTENLLRTFCGGDANDGAKKYESDLKLDGTKAEPVDVYSVNAEGGEDGRTGAEDREVAPTHNQETASENRKRKADTDSGAADDVESLEDGEEMVVLGKVIIVRKKSKSSKKSPDSTEHDNGTFSDDVSGIKSVSQAHIGNNSTFASKPLASQSVLTSPPCFSVSTRPKLLFGRLALIEKGKEQQRKWAEERRTNFEMSPMSSTSYESAKSVLATTASGVAAHPCNMSPDLNSAIPAPNPPKILDNPTPRNGETDNASTEPRTDTQKKKGPWNPGFRTDLGRARKREKWRAERAEEAFKNGQDPPSAPVPSRPLNETQKAHKKAISNSKRTAAHAQKTIKVNKIEDLHIIDINRDKFTNAVLAARSQQVITTPMGLSLSAPAHVVSTTDSSLVRLVGASGSEKLIDHIYRVLEQAADDQICKLENELKPLLVREKLVEAHREKYSKHAMDNLNAETYLGVNIFLLIMVKHRGPKSGKGLSTLGASDGRLSSSAAGRQYGNRRPAWWCNHLGAWHRSWPWARKTADLRTDGPVESVMTAWLIVVTRRLSRHTNAVYRRFDPTGGVTYTMYCITARLFGSPFGGFSCMTVNYGWPTSFHIDHHDSPRGYCCVTPIGQWEGCPLYFPQLDLEAPLKPAEMAIFRSSMLWHGNKKIISGTRYSFVFFTDHQLTKPVIRALARGKPEARVVVREGEFIPMPKCARPDEDVWWNDDDWQ